MNPLISMYWKPLAALTLCLFIVGYIGYQRHEIKRLQRDNASLQQTIELTKAIGQAANEKAARIEQSSHAATIAITTQYQSDLEKVKKYNASHPTVKYIPVSVRQPTTNPGSSTVSQVPPASQGTTSSGKDTDSAPTGTSIEQSCAITTLQYNTLHEAWDKACVEFGCN